MLLLFSFLGRSLLQLQTLHTFRDTSRRLIGSLLGIVNSFLASKEVISDDFSAHFLTSLKKQTLEKLVGAPNRTEPTVERMQSHMCSENQ